jgi:phosphatidate cytidylyltransferase
LSSKRILTALALAIGVVGLLFLDRAIGSPAGSFVLVDLLAILALAELLALFRAAGDPTWMRSGVAGGIVLVATHAAWWLLFPETATSAIGWIVGGAALVAAALVALGPRGAGRTAVGTVVLVGSMLFLLELRLLSWPGHPAWGMGAVAVLIAVVKGGDSAAYFVGRTIGTRPMASRISPKKTWEGAVAGFVVGTALAPALGLGLGLMPGLGLGGVLVFGALTNVAGQIGDLVESHQKRRAGMKDSGRYLGELGGALDVLDAILLAAPVAYVTVHLLAPGGGEAG